MLLPKVCLIASWATFALAFYPWVPDYRCAELGTCHPGHKREDLLETTATSSIKIVQRLPSDDASHDVHIARLADRLFHKYWRGDVAPGSETDEQVKARKRSNSYTVKSAPTPSQATSAGVYQDGTDYSYFAPATFGSAKTQMYMLLDTGADQSWVMSGNCASSACQVHNLFDASTSTSAKVSTNTFNIKYGSGSVSGLLADDIMTFAGMNLAMTFGLATITSDDFLNFPIDGILGLSLAKSNTPSFIDRLVASKALKSNIFGVSLNRMADGSNTGEINFGAPDTTRYTGNLNYIAIDTPNSSGNWAIPMDNVGFGKAQAGLTGRLAVFDTGTSFIFCPPEDAATFHSLIKGSSTDNGITYHVPCTTTDSVTFTFGGTAYSVSTKDWIGPAVNGVCTSNIYGRSVVGANWLVGDTFLKNVYAVFDADKTRIGLGAVTVSAPPSSTPVPPPAASSSISRPPSSVPATSGTASVVSIAAASASKSSSTTASTTALPGMNGHETSAAGTVAAETAASSAAKPTTTSVQLSNAKRLDASFSITLIAIVVLAKHLA